MTARAFEVQCDGLVGPTHNYAGLSHGNVASQSNAQSISAPRQAALQGLAKMRFVSALGVPQIVVPPQPRPHLRWLHRLGFTGSLGQVLDAAWKASPSLLYQAYSASSMWAANMATVSPSADTADGRLHLTPANLCTTPHRVQEQDITYPLLQAIFGKVADIHAPLPSTPAYADEGAANHMRFCGEIGAPGVEVFVYGRVASDRTQPQPVRYPARQTRESVEALARLHQLPHARHVLVQQRPEAIDAGVFHNDVIAMSHGNLLVYHAQAFVEEAAFLQALQAKLAPVELIAIRLSEDELPLDAAVRSYLFNSQIVSLPEGGMAIIAPSECADTPAARIALDRLVQAPDVPVRAVHYLDVRESMRNGGGPACLRLRVPMTDAEWAGVHPAFVFTPALDAQLQAWISKHYRETLRPDDLRDPQFASEAFSAWEALGDIFPLPPSQTAGDSPFTR
jgi:succinylarginine dihydrolase